MSTRETIKKGLADVAWWMAWSDHAEEHRCANLCGARIEEIAPKVPAEILERAEEALRKIEARMKACAEMERAIKDLALDYVLDTCESEGVTVTSALYLAAHIDIRDRNLLLVRAAHNGSPWSYAECTPIDLYENTDYAHRFGMCLGYAIAGAGVSWSDDHADVPLPDLYYCSDINDRARDIADSTCEHGKPESEES